MIIDRIEGLLAVVEHSKGGFEDIPLADIHGKARDGAVIHRDGQGSYVVDEAETERRARHAADRLHQLFAQSDKDSQPRSH